MITFNQSTYSISENDGLVQPVVLLSNPASIKIIGNIEIGNNNNATGE